MDVLIILQLTRSVHLRKRFSGENKERKTQCYKKHMQIRYFNILLSAKEKTATVLRVSSLTKVEVRNFLLLHFLRCICFIHGQLDISLRLVKRLVKRKCQRFCLFDIQKWSVLS